MSTPSPRIGSADPSAVSTSDAAESAAPSVPSSPPPKRGLLPSLAITSMVLFATYSGLIAVLLPNQVAAIDDANPGAVHTSGGVATAKVSSYPPNDYGFQTWPGTSGDGARTGFQRRTMANQRTPTGPRPRREGGETRGSYLCHESYGNRYRVAARSSSLPDSSSGNHGLGRLLCSRWVNVRREQHITMCCSRLVLGYARGGRDGCRGAPGIKGNRCAERKLRDA